MNYLHSLALCGRLFATGISPYTTDVEQISTPFSAQAFSKRIIVDWIVQGWVRTFLNRMTSIRFTL